MTSSEWLKLTDVFRCVLVEIDYKEQGQIKTACFARGNFRSAGTDSPAYTPYRDFIVGGLTFSDSIDSALFGETKTNSGDVSLLSHPVSESLLTKAVPGNQIRIYIGDETWTKAEFYQVATLISDGVGISGNNIKVTFKEFSEDMEAPVLAERTLDDKLIPICLGRVFNITPVLIDPLTSKYKFNIESSQALTAAKFNGDVVAPESYVVDLAESTITFNTMPIGQITLDVDGINTGSWKQTASDIISHIFPGAVIEPGLATYLLGIFIDDETSLSDLLDDITGSIGAFWRFDESGSLHIQEFKDVTGVSVNKISDDHNQEDSRRVAFTLVPSKEVVIGYARNYTKISNVAGNVYTTDPSIAEHLQSSNLVTKASDIDIAEAFVKSAIIEANTAIVNKADAVIEAVRRLNIGSTPRVIYQTKQMAAGFKLTLGKEVKLTTPGINGTNAIVTRKDYSILNDTVTLEFWQ